jgi:hypothetical protein
MEIAHNPLPRAAIANRVIKRRLRLDRSRRYCPLGKVVIRASKRGLSNAAKDLLFVATRRSGGTELLRHAHLHRQQTKAPGLSAN